MIINESLLSLSSKEISTRINELNKVLEERLDEVLEKFTLDTGFPKTWFNREQRYQIRGGLEAGLDVSVYVDLMFNFWQMAQIRLGLEAGIDVSVYAIPIFNWRQMYEIRMGLEAGIDVSSYAEHDYTEAEIEEIKNSCRLNIAMIIHHNILTHEEMYEIRKKLENKNG